MPSKIRVSAHVPTLPEPPDSDRVAAPPRQFLIPIDPSKTIGELYSEIHRRYTEQYLQKSNALSEERLFIVKLQDEFENDLAHDDLISDIFDDQAKHHNVKVIRGHLSRYSSIPVNSTLRPQAFRSLPTARKRSAPRDDSASKRLRLDPVQEERCAATSLNPDKPIPSRERSLSDSPLERATAYGPQAEVAATKAADHQQDLETHSEASSLEHLDNFDPLLPQNGERSSIASSQAGSRSDDAQETSRALRYSPGLANLDDHISKSQDSMDIDSRALLNPASSPPSNQHHARKMASSPNLPCKQPPATRDDFRKPSIPERLRKQVEARATPQLSSPQSMPAITPTSQETPTKVRGRVTNQELYDNEDIWNVPGSPDAGVRHALASSLSSQQEASQSASAMSRELDPIRPDAVAHKDQSANRPPSRAITKDRAFEAVRAARRARGDEDDLQANGDRSSPGIVRQANGPHSNVRSDRRLPLPNSSSNEVAVIPTHRPKDSGQDSIHPQSAPRERPPSAAVPKSPANHTQSFGASNTYYKLVNSPESRSARRAKEQYMITTLEKKKPPFMFSTGPKSASQPAASEALRPSHDATSTPRHGGQTQSKLLGAASQATLSSSSSATPVQRVRKGTACKGCYVHRRKCIIANGQEKCERCMEMNFRCVKQDSELEFAPSRSQSAARKPLPKTRSNPIDKGKGRATNPFDAAKTAAVYRKERAVGQTSSSQLSPVGVTVTEATETPIGHDSPNMTGSSRSPEMANEDSRDRSASAAQVHSGTQQDPVRVASTSASGSAPASPAPSASSSSSSPSDEEDELVEQDTSDEEDKTLQAQIVEVAGRGGSHMPGKISQLISSMFTPFSSSQTNGAARAWHEVPDTQATPPPMRTKEGEDAMAVFSTPRKSNG